MAKPRASGADAIQLIGFEAVYGTPPDGSGGGVYYRLPMRSDDVSASQGLEDDDTWNRGTPEDGDASLGSFVVSGDIAAPFDARGIGWLLKAALGVEAVTNVSAGLYEHEFRSGKDLPSLTKQVLHPKLAVPKSRTQFGLKVGQFSFPMARNGRAIATLSMTGQGEVKDVTGARDAGPISYAYLPYDNCLGAVKLNGAAVANLTGAQFNLSNGLDVVETIRSDMQIDGIDETVRKCSGSANVRLGNDAAIDNLVDASGFASLEFDFTIASQATWFLKFILPRVRFERSKKPVNGPGGIEQAVNWRASYDSVSGYMLRVLLRNDVVSY